MSICTSRHHSNPLPLPVNGQIDFLPPKWYNSGMNAQTVLEKAKRLAKKKGMTYQEVGERMGYPPKSARQSVSQFLNSTSPTVEMLIRYAKAMGVNARDLL